VSALIWCPFPDQAAAIPVVARLLDEKLIACANMLGQSYSMYDWNGARGEASECPVLFKTDATLLERAVARIAELHPYDAPAVLGWRCDAVAPATAAWLGALAG
jgi:periplasmic divalent cation tolerance protein